MAEMQSLAKSFLSLQKVIESLEFVNAIIRINVTHECDSESVAVT